MAATDGFDLIEADDHSPDEAIKFLRKFLRKNRGLYWGEVTVDNSNGLTLTSYSDRMKLHFNTPRCGADNPETRAAAKIMSLTQWGEEAVLLQELIDLADAGGVYWKQSA